MAVLASKSSDRADPNVLRLVEAMDATAQQRDAIFAGGLLEVAKAMKPQPTPAAVIRTEMEVERDDRGRVLRSMTVSTPEGG